MRNAQSWTPTRYEPCDGNRWRASRASVPIGSRLIGDLVAEAYRAAIETHARGRLADLGCGDVPLYGIYKEKVTDVHCVDWPGSLHGSEHIDTYADLNQPLELEPESFETVIATDVIEHLHAPQQFFASVARILRPGGAMIVGCPFLYWIHEGPHDFFRYTCYALDKLSRDAGLTVLSLKPFAGAPEVFADLATKLAGSRPRVARAVYWLSAKVLALGPIKSLSTRSASLMPMGYILVAQKPLI